MQYEFDIRNDTQNRWRDILSSLGVPENFLRNKMGPCPMCGGKDRYRFTDKDGHGMWICNQCGAGNGVQLAMQYLKMDFMEVLRAVQPLVGSARVQHPRQIDEAKLRKQRSDLWSSGSPIVPGMVVDKYLVSRLGRSIASTELRSVTTDDGVTMLARVLSADGKRVETLHRTLLTKEGAKVPGDSPRKMMPGSCGKGVAVRLMPPVDGTIGIAEGIETALSAHILFGVPVWSALNAGFLSSWNPPEDITRVYIFGDNDRSMTGQAAAFECARRCVAAGKQVEVKIPDTPGDWNDVLKAKQPEPLKAA